MIYLWPYAMRTANEAVNNNPNMQDKFKRTPTEIMFNTLAQMNIKHWYPFAYPAYVLENKLQDARPMCWKTNYKMKRNHITNGRVGQR